MSGTWYNYNASTGWYGSNYMQNQSKKNTSFVSVYNNWPKVKNEQDTQNSHWSGAGNNKVGQTVNYHFINQDKPADIKVGYIPSLTSQSTSKSPQQNNLYNNLPNSTRGVSANNTTNHSNISTSQVSNTGNLNENKNSFHNNINKNFFNSYGDTIANNTIISKKDSGVAYSAAAAAAAAASASVTQKPILGSNYPGGQGKPFFGQTMNPYNKVNWSNVNVNVNGNSNTANDYFSLLSKFEGSSIKKTPTPLNDWNKVTSLYNNPTIQPGQTAFVKPQNPYMMYTYHQPTPQQQLQQLQQSPTQPPLSEHNHAKIIKFSSFSQGGQDQTGSPKTNQDSFITKQDSQHYTFGVFDGHGVQGHLVSNAIKTFFNNTPSSQLSSPQSLLSTFASLSKSIMSSTFFNAIESGSTCVVCHITPDNTLYCANCGDSRAILISQNNNNVIPLSIDHKPELPEERKRIESSGGRVDRVYGMGPFRVWLKYENYPGLAMSRSIGDGIAHSVGVSDIPEIKAFNIDELNPMAIVIGSDGVFEFLSNEQIKDIVGQFYYSKDSEGCAREIVQRSNVCWKREGCYVDDITAVVIFYEKNSF